MQYQKIDSLLLKYPYLADFFTSLELNIHGKEHLILQDFLQEHAEFLIDIISAFAEEKNALEELWRMDNIINGVRTQLRSGQRISSI